MTPEAQRMAIAEACGWKEIISAGIYAWERDGNPRTMQARPPDYLNDLNAMHEAEKTLTEKQAIWYLQKLSQVRLKQGEGGMIACMLDRMVFATAAQRAEAFLRTIGKWRDE